jgi:hypothetical protein
MLYVLLNESRNALEAQLPTVATAAAACMTARALHARLLAVAAARRLRAADRLARQRPEDAEFWLTAAPSALNKAAAMRAELAPLP